MESKQSLCVHALLLIIGGVTQCLAVKQITVLKGRSLTLTCPIKNVNSSDHVEWRNPDGFLMFFNEYKALKDKRNEVVTLTRSEYTVRISDVMFKDGGVYKCLHYAHPVVTKRFKVIVLSDVIMEKTEHEDKTIIKCSASANGHPPTLSWLLDNGLEIYADPNYVLENGSKKYTAVSLLQVKTMKRPTTVKCLARHPALYGSPLIDFIHIGPHGKKTSPTSGYTTTSTTTEEITATLVPHFSSTSFGNTLHSSSQSQPETTDAPETANSTMSYNNTKVNETTGSISETTEGTSVNASTVSSNNTLGDEDENGGEKQRSERGNSALLVLLVTCLIFCLIVVIAFFLLRLRRAHMAWKQENEENDQSMESSRSKSSNEEKQKQNQQQRGRGFLNTSFTKYKVEEAAASGTMTPPAALEVPDEKPHHSNHTVLKSCVRETEL